MKQHKKGFVLATTLVLILIVVALSTILVALAGSGARSAQNAAKRSDKAISQDAELVWASNEAKKIINYYDEHKAPEAEGEPKTLVQCVGTLYLGEENADDMKDGEGNPLMYVEENVTDDESTPIGSKYTFYFNMNDQNSGYTLIEAPSNEEECKYRIEFTIIYEQLSDVKVCRGRATTDSVLYNDHFEVTTTSETTTSAVETVAA